jgi:hypothetical protein
MEHFESDHVKNLLKFCKVGPLGWAGLPLGWAGLRARRRPDPSPAGRAAAIAQDNNVAWFLAPVRKYYSEEERQ